MIGLHLLGVVATSILGRENLVAAMITGRKRLAARPIGLGASREP
jgi:cytochrome b